MKHHNYTVIRASGSNNPFPEADGWFKILEFQTNSPSTTTFDPTIVATSGMFGWDLGDGTIIYWDKAISHTYADSSTKTVKLYGKGTCNISTVDFRSDHIVGILDISNDAFKTTTSYLVNSNALLTNIIFSSSPTATISQIWGYSCNITGTLDLSMFTAFTNILVIQFYSNPLLTGVIFASSVVGKVSSLRFESCNITGTLDLSMFTALSISASIYFYSNPLLTGVTFASSVTEGSIGQIWGYSCNITGTLDLSMFTAYDSSSGGNVNFNYNANMTAVLFSGSTITGYIKNLGFYHCTSLGFVDLSKLNNTSANSLNWEFRGCNWSAAIVNHVLYDIDLISVGGYTLRVISIGESNAEPDTTSGGYDGVSARNSLITKGFSVNTT